MDKKDSVNNKIIPSFDDIADDKLKIYLEKIRGIEELIILTLVGHIDTYNAINFMRRVDKVITSGTKKIVFNCLQLTYVSSTGVGAFVEISKAIQEVKGTLVLVSVQSLVKQVFELLGFYKYFNFVESVPTAINLAMQEKENFGFPKAFTCPVCRKNLRAIKEGRFRCPNCKTIILISKEAKVSIFI